MMPARTTGRHQACQSRDRQQAGTHPRMVPEQSSECGSRSALWRTSQRAQTAGQQPSTGNRAARAAQSPGESSRTPRSAVIETGAVSAKWDSAQVLVAEVAAASADVGATSSRLAKTAASPRCCARPDRTTWPWSSPGCRASCRSARSASAGPRCAIVPDAGRRSRRSTVGEVDAAFDADRRRRPAPARRRPARASSPACSARRPSASSAFLRRLLGGELRQGAQAGVMADAVARAADVPAGGSAPRGDAVRRPARAWRSAALRGRAAGRLSGCRSADRSRRCSRRPRRAPSDALDQARRAARVRDEARRRAHPGPPRRRRRRDLHAHAGRRHRRGCPRSSRPCSRCRSDASCSTARRSRCGPTAARTRSRSPRRGSARARTSTPPAAALPLSPFFFDVLHVDGDDLLDAPAVERLARARRASSPHGCASTVLVHRRSRRGRGRVLRDDARPAATRA